MEEHHLQERHQLVKQQLKDQYFLQRHELVRKHEKVRRGLPRKELGRAVRPRRDGAPLEYKLCSQEEPGVGHGEARGGSWDVLPQMGRPGIGETMQGSRRELPHALPRVCLSLFSLFPHLSIFPLSLSFTCIPSECF